VDSISQSLTKPAIEVAAKLLMPLLTSVTDGTRKWTAVAAHDLFNSFQRYISESFERNSYLITLVFPNEQKRLEDFYLPLTLQLVQQGEILRETKVARYPTKLLKQYKDLLIVDSAGMGKSTLMRFMYLQAVKTLAGIPLFIELRRLAKAPSLLEYIYLELRELDGSIDRQLVNHLILRGDFIFFLDGFDEIPSASRADVIASIRELKVHASNSHFVISSREETYLNSFAEYQRFRIKPLSLQEAFSLIEKYGRNERITAALKEKLQLPENAPVHEFLTNPLLVSLLFKSFDYKRTVPSKKHIFYRQVFDALYEEHDLSKDDGGFVRELNTKLDSYRFHLVLRSLGYQTMQGNASGIEYSQDELLRLIKLAQDRCLESSFTPSALLSDLLQKVPLFVRDGLQIRWSHKSLQEYFCACYIQQDAKDKVTILENISKARNVNRFSNLLTIYFELDRKTFRHVVLRPLLEYWHNRYGQVIKKQRWLDASSMQEVSSLASAIALSPIAILCMPNAEEITEPGRFSRKFEQLLSELRTRESETDNLRSAALLYRKGSPSLVLAQDPNVAFLKLLGGNEEARVVRATFPPPEDWDEKGLLQQLAAAFAARVTILDADTVLTPALEKKLAVIATLIHGYQGDLYDDEAGGRLLGEIEQEIIREKEFLELG